MYKLPELYLPKRELTYCPKEPARSSGGCRAAWASAQGNLAEGLGNVSSQSGGPAAEASQRPKLDGALWYDTGRFIYLGLAYVPKDILYIPTCVYVYMFLCMYIEIYTYM